MEKNLSKLQQETKTFNCKRPNFIANLIKTQNSNTELILDVFSEETLFLFH